MIEGNIGGPINSRTSYFVDFERRDVTDNADINATELSPQTLQPFQLQEAVVTPSVRYNFNPRVDYALNDKNTLVLRLQDEFSNQSNAGLGTTTLPSAGRTRHRRAEKGGYITETAILKRSEDRQRDPFSLSERDRVRRSVITRSPRLQLPAPSREAAPA